ncbi:hypothetical protein Mame01_62600 [Microbispora amethystogenes]|nr:hypothetical protein Mame01_62600 [Microbispora amethystogenes]
MNPPYDKVPLPVRTEILRYDRGLAASPPVRYSLKVAGDRLSRPPHLRHPPHTDTRVIRLPVFAVKRLGGMVWGW